MQEISPIKERCTRFPLLAGATVAALVTCILFLPALSNQFVDFDDVAYIVENHHIEALDGHTVVWAFTSFHEANWHPLTMLSLAVDRQLWGLNPSGFHLTSIVFHSGTVFLATLLFASLLETVFLAGMPCDERHDLSPEEKRIVLWGSVGGALFFGLHPLRVESVAWASERKDVLCLFFVVATIYCYLRYRQRLADGLRQPCHTNGMVLILAGLACMSKPTAVSLPFLLLVLDWYPLGRVVDCRTLFEVVKEKSLLFLMAAGVSVLTMVAQREAMAQVPEAILSSRFLVACKAIITYLWQMFWPGRLAPLYLHPGNVVQNAVGEYSIFALAVVAISMAVWILRRRQRLWAALWMYYLLTLAPVLGIVQVGGQWLANRYSYLPSLGVSLLWGGGGAWLATRIRKRWSVLAALILLGAAACQLCIYSSLTRRQIHIWRTTETLATRQIDMMPHQSGAAYYSRAKYRLQVANIDGALDDLDEALAIAERKGLHRKLPALHFTRATALVRLGHLDEALAAADRAISLSSGDEAEEFKRFRVEIRQRLDAPVNEK